jgi:hypothetical protein
MVGDERVELSSLAALGLKPSVFAISPIPRLWYILYHKISLFSRNSKKISSKKSHIAMG